MRPTSEQERKILELLFEKAGLSFDAASLSVEPMDDGGTGSLKLSKYHAVMRFGRMAADVQLTDTDGIPVLFSLYLDEQDKPYELDAFKSDYSPTQFLGYAS